MYTFQLLLMMTIVLLPPYPCTHPHATTIMYNFKAVVAETNDPWQLSLSQTPRCAVKGVARIEQPAYGN